MTSHRLLAILLIISSHALILLASKSTNGDKNGSTDESNNKLLNERRHCDMEFCRTIVNRCTSLNKCSCDFKKDLFCAKACLECLNEKFGKCCACVGKC